MERKEELELNKLVADFNSWQEATSEILKENEVLQKELKSAYKRIANDCEATQAKTQENAYLRAAVDKLHGILAQRCDLEEENKHLRNDLLAMSASANELEKTHSCQMTEALENLRTLSATHEAELASTQHEAQLKLRQEVVAKDKEVQDKVVEVKMLQREKAELERMRHTDIVKLRLEYDAKMLKLQKQQNSTRTPHPSSSNNDIFRKKLHHAKAESEREITHLKRRVEELERQKQPASKRTRLM